MGAHSYEDLRHHIGHKIACVCYGQGHEYEGDPANVAVECETCGEVLLDYDNVPLENENDSITIKWTIDDIRTQLAHREENRDETYLLYTSELQDILKEVERSHDATVGINWGTLDCAIDNFLHEHPEKIHKEDP